MLRVGAHVRYDTVNVEQKRQRKLAEKIESCGKIKPSWRRGCVGRTHTWGKKGTTDDVSVTGNYEAL